MLIWEKETNAIIGEVFKLKPEYQLKETKIRPTTALEATIKSPPIFFAPQLKTYIFKDKAIQYSCRVRIKWLKWRTIRAAKWFY